MIVFIGRFVLAWGGFYESEEVQMKISFISLLAGFLSASPAVASDTFKVVLDTLQIEEQFPDHIYEPGETIRLLSATVRNKSETTTPVGLNLKITGLGFVENGSDEVQTEFLGANEKRVLDFQSQNLTKVVAGRLHKPLVYPVLRIDGETENSLEVADGTLLVRNPVRFEGQQTRIVVTGKEQKIMTLHVRNITRADLGRDGLMHRKISLRFRPTTESAFQLREANVSSRPIPELVKEISLLRSRLQKTLYLSFALKDGSPSTSSADYIAELYIDDLSGEGKKLVESYKVRVEHREH